MLTITHTQEMHLHTQDGLGNYTICNLYRMFGHTSSVVRLMNMGNSMPSARFNPTPCVTSLTGGGELAQLVSAWGMCPRGHGYESRSWL